MKKRLVLIAVVIMALVAVTMIYQTFATSSSVSSSGNIHTITLSGTSEINIPANSSKTIIYQITNTNKGIVQYGVAYKGTNIDVKVYNNSEDSATGTIDYGENRFVKLYIRNTGSSSSTAIINAVLGYEHGGDLVLPSGYSLVSEGYYDCSVFETAIQCINAMYLENKNKIVKNGEEGSEVEYQYATSVNLMNDRLGGTTEDYDAGNIRYYGANPNNYVDIGDRTSDGKVIPYRIIGVFRDMELEDGTKKDLIKVIRSDVLDGFIFDIGNCEPTGDGCNDWSTANLMTLLNPGYETQSINSSLWWNSNSGTCYTDSWGSEETCDFTSVGLSNNAKIKIETVVWNLGGAPMSSEKMFSSNFYQYERGTNVYSGNATEWLGEVALMYVSDYGYATDFNSCSNPVHYAIYDYDSTSADMYSYDVDGCYNSDWLFINNYEYLLNHQSLRGDSLWWLGWEGYITTDYWEDAGVGYESTPFRPTFYLNAGLNIKFGSGTINDPYVIG